MRKTPTQAFTLRIHYIAKKAVRVSQPSDEKDVGGFWLPMSQVEFEGDAGDVTDFLVPEWLALQKGLLS